MYEELIKSLRICGAPISCEGCPHYADEDPNCYLRLKIEAADAIEALSKELMDLKMLTCCCCEPPKEEDA